MDDRRENLTALAGALEPLGVDVVTARSADEALRAVLLQDIAVVLLDVEMPGTDGYEAARLIRARQRSRAVPIIFITAMDRDRKHDLAGYAAGGVDFLYKPVDGDILRAKVATFLELHRLRSETQVARELLESERRGAAIVASALDCIVSTDSCGCITGFNPAAEQTFGYSRAEVMGRPIADVIVPPEYREAHGSGMARYARTGQARVLGRRMELPAMRSDGSTFLSEITIVRVPGEDPPEFTAFLRDISGARMVADRVRTLQETTEALATAQTPQHVAAAIVDRGLSAFGACAGFIVALGDDGTTLEVLASSGIAAAGLDMVRSMSLDRDAPALEAIRTGRAVFVESDDAWNAKYASTSALWTVPGCTAWAGIPLIADGRILGAMGLAFAGDTGPGRMDEEGRAFIVSVAQLCAQAFDRARLQVAEHEARLAAERARTAADEARIEAERLARKQAAILASLPEVIAVVDRDGRYLETPGPHHIPGTRPDRVGRLMADVLPPSAAAIMMSAVQTALATGVAQEVEFGVETGDGMRWFEGTVIRLEDDGALCVARDVTAARLAEAALRARDRYHQAVLAATNEVIWDVDVATERVQWSDGIMDTVGAGMPFDMSTMDGWFRRVHPDDVTRVRESVVATIEGGGTTWSAEYRLRRGDGSYATMLVRAIVLRTADGRAEKMVGSMLDLSDRQKLEEQLRQAQKMEAVGQLAGGVAHDFNNLLTVISSYAALSLDEMPAEDPAREALEEIAGAAERAAALTRQLLTFSRQSVRRTQIVALNDCIRSEERMLRRLVPEHIAISTTLSTEVCTIEVDPQQVGQILVNLAVNAGDAMPEGGRLDITTAYVTLDETFCSSHVNVRPGAYGLLSVSDTGSGMTAETLQHLFEPFYTTKPPGKGTGLGLATVYGIVAQSNAHIWVYSELGQGTTFKIYFPIARAVAKPASVPRGLAPRGSETILVVDDDESVRKVLVRTLRHKGYEVVEAAHGHSALALLDTEGGARPGLLLTDVVMPTMGAKELIPAVRARAPDMRIVLMSGYSVERIDEAAWAEGAAFLEKPFTGDELLRRVREALDAEPSGEADGWR